VDQNQEEIEVEDSRHAGERLGAGRTRTHPAGGGTDPGAQQEPREKRRRFGRQPRTANPSSAPTKPGRGAALREKPREPWRRRISARGGAPVGKINRKEKKRRRSFGRKDLARSWEKTGARTLARGGAETWHGAATLRERSQP
jgi:hypothetical protein